MLLWGIIPDRFFSLLASQNRVIYAEALLLLFESHITNQFGIPYDVLRDALQEMLETHAEQGLQLVEEEGDAKQAAALDDELGRARAQAAALVRRLEAYGWVNIEDRANYERYIVLPFYSSRILSVLKELCERRSVEYQRYAFETYQHLSGPGAKGQPSSAILAARDTTARFMEALRELANNMKQYMQEVANQTTVQDVLIHHFDQYKSKVIDSSYHRLKTSDHVSRYRQRILEIIQDWLLDEDFLVEAVAEGLASGQLAAQDTASDDLRAALQFIDEAYRKLDFTLNEIDLRHNQYLRASFDRARYLGQFSHGVDQMLAHILNWLADGGEELPSGLVRLQSIDQLTEGSLYAPRKPRRPHQPSQHFVLPVSDELRRAQRQQNLARLQKAITREKVQAYVLERLGERQEMEMLELAPTNLDEYLYLAAVYLYGYDGRAGYRLQRSSSRATLLVGDFVFDQRIIVRNRTTKGGVKRAE